jgi:CBS domain-containing protein
MINVLEVTVGDIMQRDVTTVGPETSVRELTRILSDHGISGVPVVTASGTVVGVVSSTDVVRLAADEFEVGMSGGPWRPGGLDGWDSPDEDEDEDEETPESAGFFLPERSSRAPELDLELEEDAFDGYRVADIMTPVSFAMSPTASVRELADFLLRGRIHRAVVTENGHLVGIVTTMDVLRALADGI